jgi:molybdate transport system substrate-binding protein
MRALRAVAVVAGLLATTTLSSAAEIKALSPAVMKAALDELLPAFERATGNKVVIGYASSGEIAQRLFKREVCDVVLIGRGEMVRLVKEKKVNDSFSVARTGYGVAVKKGAPRPDVSTPEALKKALLAAKSIAQPSLARGGAAAFTVQRVFARLRITDQVQAKIMFAPAKVKVSTLLASGKAEIGVQQMPELMADPGVDVIGPLPDRLQETTEIAAGLTAASKQPDAARALIKHLTSPEAMALYKAKGLGL